MNIVVVMFCCIGYIPGVKSSSDGAVHGGLLNVLEKAYADDSLRVALLQLTEPGCSCSDAEACLVSMIMNAGYHYLLWLSNIYYCELGSLVGKCLLVAVKFCMSVRKFILKLNSAE